jgi:hypothetical protein
MAKLQFLPCRTTVSGGADPTLNGRARDTADSEQNAKNRPSPKKKVLAGLAPIRIGPTAESSALDALPPAHFANK